MTTASSESSLSTPSIVDFRQSRWLYLKVPTFKRRSNLRSSFSYLHWVSDTLSNQQSIVQVVWSVCSQVIVVWKRKTVWPIAIYPSDLYIASRNGLKIDTKGPIMNADEYSINHGELSNLMRNRYNIRYLEMRKLQTTKKRNSSSSKTIKHNSSVSYDSFLFVDNITNSRIMLKDARKHYQSRRPPSQHRIEQQQELNVLSDCLSTLKSTKLFQLDSLRSKLFRSVHARKPTDDDMQETKRGLRQLIQSSIQQLSIRQLRECFADPTHRVQPRIIALQSLSGHKLTKSNIESLMANPNPKPTQRQHTRIPIQRSPQQIQFQMKEQKELLEQANNYLTNNLRSNSSHLVKPKYQKELYQKLYSACMGKKIPKKAMAFSREEPRLKIQGEGVFQPILKGATAQSLQQKLSRPPAAQGKENRQIVYAVENNLFFDVQILITMDRELAQAKDAQGNNLLHITAKNRNQELFTFLLKKAGPNALSAKNNLGRTPQDLARLYGATTIVNLCQNYSPYS